MTEFELAQLEYMVYAREQGLIGLMQTQAGLVANDLALWTGVLFGYLLVAYFVGSQLTKVQAAILNALYLAVSGASVFSLLTGGLTIVGFANQYAMVSGNEKIATVSPEYTFFGIALNIACIVASLYFMWSVRHPKAE
ncbi:hypothetical protein EYC98_18495 [Halieaceae bacterium IMCC14734]|uniref:Uncharacterized protein n=1 Tax=Candidatus Litorirhabdus singularis TaxID=2518993 RepID=A0ABT3TKK1_9GAMM|nr:hypothetical protein [Candidatus Litorirhabdus singularis]MCX2982857.1 hypothetical protein [Candidatus Litorirhabdus singularis]